MLETDDIDDDYFTPIPTTSLANVFTKIDPAGHCEDTVNESLKYRPLKPNKVTKPIVESKVTDCLIACVLFAYEWSGENYVPKGKIGLAIIRNNKNDNHDIVLYDSNKRTLSCATITPRLEVTIKGGNYVSYHDNIKKLWTLYSTEEEVRKISDLLKSLNVEVKNCLHCTEGEPEPIKTENENNFIQNVDLMSKESDTDSSMYNKTKMSILNRMATMGQSVLPRRAISSDITSDSSDNENIHSKTLKHKSTKGILKKIDKPQCESEMHVTTETIVPTLLPQTSISTPLYTLAVNGQLVQLDNNSTDVAIRTDSSNNINMLMSEQRICNSEIRINMGRLTDKMDQMLDRIKGLENRNSSNNTPYNAEVDLYKKLISEYEYKIKIYEDKLSKGADNFTKQNKESLSETQNVEQAYQSTVDVKNNEIDLLKKELADTKYQNDKLKSIINNLTEEIVDIKKNFASKEKELLVNISKTMPTGVIKNSSDVEENLKSVMNETFHTISAHFESDVSYSGKTIKNVIAAIIKQVTINSIKE